MGVDLPRTKKAIAMRWLSELNVLVVDDRASIISLLKTMLADLDVTHVFAAKDGKDALELLGAKVEIDIIICDWNMPRMSGLELLQHVRTMDRDMPFIMLTGRADSNSVKEARDLGVSDYLVKPFSPQDLERKLVRMARLRIASR